MIEDTVILNLFFDLLETFIIELWQSFDFNSPSSLSLICTWKNYSSPSSKVWIGADPKLTTFSGEAVPAQFAEFHAEVYAEYWGHAVTSSAFYFTFDSDIQLILAHEHLSRQPRHSSHMSII